jgi:hypothetical protein
MSKISAQRAGDESVIHVASPLYGERVSPFENVKVIALVEKGTLARDAVDAMATNVKDVPSR